MFRGWKFVLIAVAALALACLSPTLPLPPPDAPTQSLGPQPGMVHFHGIGVEANTMVISRSNFPNPSENLTDQQRVAITLADAQGVWDMDVWAVKGDVLEVWQEFDNKNASPTIDVTITVN
jgi:hypothetical protein